MIVGLKRYIITFMVYKSFFGFLVADSGGRLEDII